MIIIALRAASQTDVSATRVHVLRWLLLVTWLQEDVLYAMRVTGHLFPPPPPLFSLLFFDSICVMTNFFWDHFCFSELQICGENMNCRHHCVCMCVSGI